MSTLFDVTPDEPVKGKKRPKVVPPAESDEKTQKSPYILGKSAARILGRTDGVYACADEACGAMALDIIDDYRGEWTLECCFCGTISREPAIEGHMKPKEDEFVFRDGRFEGQTIDEALSHPRGKDYVEWAAASHPRPAVRDACRKRLDAVSAGA
jgi:hypothetical protein